MFSLLGRSSFLVGERQIVFDEAEKTLNSPAAFVIAPPACFLPLSRVTTFEEWRPLWFLH